MKQIEEKKHGRTERATKKKSKPVPVLRGLWFAPAKPVVEKPKREKKPKAKNDPKHVAAARELRDRWLERVNADPSLLVSQSKYEVSKALSAPAVQAPALRALPEPVAA
jgi:hypothetical protein